MGISKNTFSFLNQLGKNNNRDWFAENKSLYTTAHEDIIEFSNAVLENMHAFDKIDTPSGKKALKRIYRDVRFSKNKAPYKQHFGMMYSRYGAERRGTYYIHLQPGESFIGGGFWGPEKDDLLRYKQFLIMKSFTDEEVLSPDFANQAAKTLKGMLPFFDVMTEMLTTNLNGESLVG